MSLDTQVFLDMQRYGTAHQYYETVVHLLWLSGDSGRIRGYTEYG